MDKVYNHSEYEEKIYKKWESSGAFSPIVNKKKKPFTIIMPPPNANDPLHIGHARFVAIEDILARYHRMQGEPTLWLPGTDHAGIETQYVFEKKLREKGKSRFDYDRDTLYKMIWDYVQQNSDTSISQMKRLGASADWSRLKFTLDPDIVKVIYGTFKKLYDEGLIYRGERIVNYCTRCGTSFSELEVNHVERDDELYYLDYGTLTIATTRPEPIFADVAVAVHPKDKRYKHLIGKKAIIPIINREIPIITDAVVDPSYGAGAVKVSPGHDKVDFEIAQRHKLPILKAIDVDGRMINVPEKYAGLYVNQAREAVVADLTETGLIKKTEKIHHTIGVCYRDKSVIEPMVSKQWFLEVKPLTKAALAAVKTRRVRITSQKFEKIAVHWLKNLKDWNISRQIVWGIRIPAWRCEKCLNWEITSGLEPLECTKCGHTKLTQDKDTFDTWFSSGQWPFATLQTTKNGDFDYFYPTSVMNTAYDILPFWVIKMVMLGLYATGEVPFKEILFHGLVRDREGQKISKSKGNVINPIKMAEKYGADALRMGIVWGALVDNDISLSEDNIRGQRNFANKLWNIARFVLSNETKIRNSKHEIRTRPRVTNLDDKWILAELKKSQKKITKLLDKYRLNEAAEELYNFIWKKFADSYLEKTKSRREDAQAVLEYVLYCSLVIAHPFMPFVTEAIYQETGKDGLLINAPWIN